MINQKTISLAELARIGNVDNINNQAKALISSQKKSWPAVNINYETLNSIRIRTFDFGHFTVITQFNPERIRSSVAKTDEKSIAGRPCFLCTENLPAEQKGILLIDKYLLLVNPYPIFAGHLTISQVTHTPQLIGNYFRDMLELSFKLTDFTLFYNGPQCGASAPDHFHFQAVGRNSLPVENELGILETIHSEIIFQNEKIKIAAVENYLRRFIFIVSDDKNEIASGFEVIYKLLSQGQSEEPMMNLLCNFHEGNWRLIVFPREKQRPSHFFRKDDSKITVSPAAVELGGVMILPFEEDFNKITKKEIEEIFSEVTLNQQLFINLILDLKRIYM